MRAGCNTSGGVDGVAKDRVARTRCTDHARAHRTCVEPNSQFCRFSVGARHGADALHHLDCRHCTPRLRDTTIVTLEVLVYLL